MLPDEEKKKLEERAIKFIEQLFGKKIKIIPITPLGIDYPKIEETDAIKSQKLIMALVPSKSSKWKRYVKNKYIFLPCRFSLC